MMRNLIRLIIPAILIHVIIAPPAQAHPISVTDAYIRVREDSIEVRLKIFLDDIYFFHTPAIDDNGAIAPSDLRQGIDRHREFLRERLIVRDLRAGRLRGRVERVMNTTLPDRPVLLTELMSHRITYEMTFPLPAPPEQLTFEHRFTDETSEVPSVVTLRLRQDGASGRYESPLELFEPLSIDFDWANPRLPESPAPAADDEAEEPTVGVFVYIEENEVRLEILVPLAVADQLAPIERTKRHLLDAAEQEAATSVLRSTVGDLVQLQIDDQDVSPIMTIVRFPQLGGRLVVAEPAATPVSMLTGHVGVIHRYAYAGRPRGVTVTRQLPDGVDLPIRCNFLIGGESVLATPLEAAPAAWHNPGGTAIAVEPAAVAFQFADSPEIRRLHIAGIGIAFVAAVWLATRSSWSRGFRLSAATALFIVAAAGTIWSEVRRNQSDIPAEMVDEIARPLTASLLRNVYRSFEKPTEVAVYDALARSVDGELLDDVYLRVQQSLTMQEQGGAVARVREVDVLETRVDESGRTDDMVSFDVVCRWRARGTVEHWGHRHERVNEYSARLTVADCDGTWKFTRIAIQDERAVDDGETAGPREELPDRETSL